MKKTLLILLLGLLIFPLFQAQFGIIKSMPLKGYFQNASPAVFSFPDWFKGDFQMQTLRHFNDSLGLKSDLVRLYNQIDFTLFNDVHASKVICGKEDYLFPSEYIRAYLGDDFAGVGAIEYRIDQLKKIQDLLWNRYRIFLLVVLCPDKPSYYPEYLPSFYQKEKLKYTNASYFARRGAEKGIHLIDFNPWFIAMKDRSRFPLIPKTGVHWSYYGAWLAADSMARYLRERSGYYIPEIVLDSIETPDLPIGEDNDMGATLNLIRDIPCPKLGYPKFHARLMPGQTKPSALFIGDSFYWNWKNSGMIRTLFGNDDFWYYCKDVYPQTDQKQLSVSEIDPGGIIKRQNIIVLVQVNGAYGNPGYGFTDLARIAVDPVMGKLLKIESSIRSHPKWMEQVLEKAAKAHKGIEQQLREDALWILQREEKENNNIK